MATDPYGVTLDRRANNLRQVLNLETFQELQLIFIRSRPTNINDVPEPFRTWLKNPRRIPDENRRIFEELANGDVVYVEIDDDEIENVVAR